MIDLTIPIVIIAVALIGYALPEIATRRNDRSARRARNGGQR